MNTTGEIIPPNRVFAVFPGPLLRYASLYYCAGKLSCPVRRSILAIFLAAPGSSAIVVAGKGLTSSFDLISRRRGGSHLSGPTRCTAISPYRRCSSSAGMLMAGLVKLPVIIRCRNRFVSCLLRTSSSVVHGLCLLHWSRHLWTTETTFGTCELFKHDHRMLLLVVDAIPTHFSSRKDDAATLLKNDILPDLLKDQSTLPLLVYKYQALYTKGCFTAGRQYDPLTNNCSQIYFFLVVRYLPKSSS